MILTYCSLTEYGLRSRVRLVILFAISRSCVSQSVAMQRLSKKTLCSRREGLEGTRQWRGIQDGESRCDTVSLSCALAAWTSVFTT